MNTKFFASALIAAVTFVAAPSFAADNISGEVGYVPTAAVASTSGLSRADVQSAARQAQPAGEGADIGAVVTATSGLARDTVRAEAVYAVRQGLTVGGEV